MSDEICHPKRPKLDRDMSTTHYSYYFVNINYPFLATSKQKALKYLKKAKEVNGKDFDGKFIPCCIGRETEFYLYQFGMLAPANQASFLDFTALLKRLKLIRFYHH